MKTMMFVLAAALMAASPATAKDVSSTGTKPQLSSKARASYASVPRHHRRIHARTPAGQTAHLRQVDDPYSYGRPDRP